MTDYSIPGCIAGGPGVVPMLEWNTQLDRLIGVNEGNPSVYTGLSYHNITTETVRLVRVRLNFEAAADVTIRATNTGDAVEGIDYSPIADVVISAGDLEADITVTLLHSTAHIGTERIVQLNLAVLDGPAQIGHDIVWDMHVRWPDNATMLGRWLSTSTTWAADNGTLQLFVSSENGSRDDGLLYIEQTGGTAVEGVHFTFLQNPIPIDGLGHPGGGSAFINVNIVPIPANISEDVTLIVDFDFIRHPPADASHQLLRRNFSNYTEDFGPHEHLNERYGRRPFTPGYPTNWTYGGDHAVGAVPSMEARLDVTVASPIGGPSWFVSGSRASLSPGKGLQGTLLKSFAEAICGDHSASGVGYPGTMVDLICRTLYVRQTENLAERSLYFKINIYDRTMVSGGENHQIEMKWDSTDLADAPILEAEQHLNTVGSGWRVITDDPLCEPMVSNGWHRLEIVYLSVPTHTDPRITTRFDNTAYAIGDWIKPEGSPDPEFSFQCTVAGTSAGSEPTWPTVDDTTVVDGGVTWTAHIPDSDHTTNRGASAVASNTEDTPVNMRQRGQYLFGDQIEFASAATSYQRVPGQYYHFDLAVKNDSTPPTITLTP